MIIDTSAVLAILFAEDDAERYAEAIATAQVRLISAANYLEAGVVVDNQIGAAAGRQLDAMISRAEISIETVTREQADIARQAYLDFGKGNHAAGLNFGDCFAYALSKSTGLPLLFKGNDFSRTDLASALREQAKPTQA
ncbi:MAG: type II toxin-antitoxin system VapC family toxin [Pseudomonadales bacterium]